MAKILYEIKEVVEPELLRQIKVYEATTEKLKFLLDIENSTYSERNFGTQTFISCVEKSSQTDNLVMNEKHSQTEDFSETNSINSETTLNNNLEENIKPLNNTSEDNIFINTIFFQSIISLLLFTNYQIIKGN